MGLDCSHDAFHGAYSAFNRLRQAVTASLGPDGSWPPHENKTLDPDKFFIPDEYTQSEWPGLWEFLTHSDCDGEISPEMCVKVADDLEKVLPKVEALGWESHGHIAARGGFVEVLRKFIAGCRAAAAEGVPLDFH